MAIFCIGPLSARSGHNGTGLVGKLVRGNEMDSASTIVTARLRLTDIDTYTLREMWSADGRTEWAEEALRLELIERGATTHELDSIATRRSEIAANAPPSTRGTLWNYGFVGRILTMAAIVVWVLIVHAMRGTSAWGFAGAIAVLGFYVYVLTRRTIAQGKHPVGWAAALLMYWQIIEAWLFLIGTVVAGLFTLVE